MNQKLEVSSSVLPECESITFLESKGGFLLHFRAKKSNAVSVILLHSLLELVHCISVSKSIKRCVSDSKQEGQTKVKHCQ